jgi:peroxiredoxin
MSLTSSRPLRLIAFLVATLAVGYAGIRVGRAIRERAAPRIVEAPPFPFRPGDAFPDVALADSSGAVTRSVDLVADRGGAVVLFLDPQCEGCVDMSLRWQSALSDHLVDEGRVVGISRERWEINQRYRNAHKLTFPIYQDVEGAFLEEHGVVSYPMEVVVAASGTILSLSDDSKSPIDPEALRSLLSP